MNTPVISLIISVYNNFTWLKLILDALHFQSFKDFEVVIADDGSDNQTCRLIEEYVGSHNQFPILHAWHKDQGWRKNMALNNAVRKSSGEYLVFIDGDCVPHPDFLRDHFRLRQKGIVMGGRRIESLKYINDMMESFTTLPKNFFGKVRLRILKNIFSVPLNASLSQLRRSLRFPFVFGKPIGIKSQGILGANFGLYRSDLEKVNGFDERYLAPGTGEDCDLDQRLGNAGILHKKASHYALMVHKCHSRLDWSSEENARLLEDTKRNNLTATPYGLKDLSHSQPN